MALEDVAETLKNCVAECRSVHRRGLVCLHLDSFTAPPRDAPRAMYECGSQRGCRCSNPHCFWTGVAPKAERDGSTPWETHASFCGCLACEQARTRIAARFRLDETNARALSEAIRDDFPPTAAMYGYPPPAIAGVVTKDQLAEVIRACLAEPGCHAEMIATRLCRVYGGSILGRIE